MAGAADIGIGVLNLLKMALARAPKQASALTQTSPSKLVTSRLDRLMDEAPHIIGLHDTNTLREALGSTGAVLSSPRDFPKFTSDRRLLLPDGTRVEQPKMKALRDSVNSKPFEGWRSPSSLDLNSTKYVLDTEYPEGSLFRTGAPVDLTLDKLGRGGKYQQTTGSIVRSKDGKYFLQYGDEEVPLTTEMVSKIHSNLGLWDDEIPGLRYLGLAENFSPGTRNGSIGNELFGLPRLEERARKAPAYISGHESRHRNVLMAEAGVPSQLIRLNSYRRGLVEDTMDALKGKETVKILPEYDDTLGERPPIDVSKLWTPLRQGGLAALK